MYQRMRRIAAGGLRRTSPTLFRTLKRALRTTAERLRNTSPTVTGILQACAHGVTGRCLQEDFFDRWNGCRDELTPPLRMLFDGTTSYAEFRDLGDELRRLLIAHGLQPNHRVLEVGSGNGKNARALTQYLNADGAYEGFDVVARGVAWCQKHITSRYPRFRFQHADIYNRTYNPHGPQRASDHRFPYADASFDLVFLTSVFTHMLPADLSNYAAEIGRVLKPGGHCFASFFLLNDETLAHMAAGQSGREFPYEWGCASCRVADRDWPEDAVAYAESACRDVLHAHGLLIHQPIAFGSWRHGPANGQDLIWAVKAPA